MKGRVFKPLTKAERTLINTAGEIRLDRATAKDASFLARQFVQATLPHADPKVDTWRRVNGNFALGLQAGFNPKTGESYGLPYGIIPRLLLFWITTEALRTNNPRLELGKSLADFMRQVGLDPAHGGPRSDAARLKEQMQRLFQARISFMQDLEEGDEQGSAWINLQISRRGVLWWNPKSPEQTTLWNSFIDLETDFFEALKAAPIPTDARILKAIKRSPLALDLYALLCYEVFRVNRTGRARLIPWHGLVKQLGADYQSATGLKDFKAKTRAALRKIAACWEGLHSTTDEEGLYILSGSVLAIPANTAD